MTKEEVLKLLEKNKNERGIANWNRMMGGKIKSYGIGLTKLKKLAKKIVKNHKLALELWALPIYDARVLSVLIEEPKEVTEEQVNRQVKDTEYWMMSYIYCSNLLPKVPFVKEKTVEWASKKDTIQRRCGYLLLYELAKDDSKLPDSFFLPYLSILEKNIQKEENFVKDAMNCALFGIGKRSKALNKRAIEAAKKIGKVEVDYGDNSCQAIDCLKHLTSDNLQKKLA